MGLFQFGKSNSPQPPPEPASPIPFAQIDLGKRYDVYCTVFTEVRLYENVRFLAFRTFERITEFTPISGYLEVEAMDGSRMLISSHTIQLMCEHGTQPTFKVLRNRSRPEEY